VSLGSLFGKMNCGGWIGNWIEDRGKKNQLQLLIKAGAHKLYNQTNSNQQAHCNHQQLLCSTLPSDCSLPIHTVSIGYFETLLSDGSNSK